MGFKMKLEKEVKATDAGGDQEKGNKFVSEVVARVTR